MHTTGEISPRNEQTLQLRNYREKINGYYRFRKGFYGPADTPTVFQDEQTVHSDTKHPHVWTA